MYQPTHFVQTDAQAIAALLRAHPLATLVHHDPQGGLVADAIPMLWQPDASGGGGAELTRCEGGGRGVGHGAAIVAARAPAPLSEGLGRGPPRRLRPPARPRPAR